MAEAVFPAFIRASYQETSDGVPAFEKAMQSSVNRARKAAELSMDDLFREVSRSTSSGQSDFGAAGMKAAAAAATVRAQAARQLASALAATAAAESDYSAVTQISIAAARRLADEEEHAALSANLHAQALQRMADAAKRSNIVLGEVTASHSSAAKAANANRHGQMMLAQQMQDVAIQAQLGINPLIILTQQGSQAAFALSTMGGRAAAVGRFLSSPWVAAIGVGVTALTMLMHSSEDAADALENVKFSSDAVGGAQSLLGNVMDITTGKISTQRTELIALALAQAKVAGIQARARADALRGEVKGLQDPTTEFSGGIGGGLSISRRSAGATGAISASFLAGEIDTTTAVQRLDNLRKAGALTEEAFAEAAKSIASLGVELANVKIYESTERLLNGAGSASDRSLLLKPKTNRPKSDRERSSGASNGYQPSARASGALPTQDDERENAEKLRIAQELDRATATLFGRYDEARAAALDYGAALAEIDRLYKAGTISADDRTGLGLQAANDNAERLKRAEDEAMADLDRKLWGDRKRPTQEISEDMEAAMRRAAEYAEEIARHMNTGLEAVADVFGPKVARFLDDMARRAGPDSALAGLVGNIGVGRDLFADNMAKAISGTLEEAFGADRLKSWGQAMGEAMGAAGVGATAGGLVLGSSNSRLGSAAGGALGNVLGKELGKTVKGGLESTFGAALGPLGSIAGGVLGGALGGLFRSTPKASATIGFGADGNLTIEGISGSSSALKAAAKQNANSAITSVESIAEALGGTIDGSKGSVSIGTYKGNYRVDTTGSGRTKGYTSSESRNESLGLFNFGEDQEAAVRFAVMDLIQDGVIGGIRASTQRLLANAKDLDAALQRALDFEGVFSRLKAYKDPVAAAIDTVDKEFSRLQTIFKDAGASTQEYADLEELYGIERAAAVKEAGEKLTASLKGLLDDLTVNNDSRSLRVRQAEAKSTYDALADRVRAGDTTAYDDFAAAARTYVDIQQQISGSTQDYFALLDQVTALTSTAVDAQTSLNDAAAGRAGIFAPTESAFSAAPIVSATETQTAALSKVFNDGFAGLGSQIGAMNDNLIRSLRTSGGSSASPLYSDVQNF